jgi:hypothetical protein
MKLPSKSTGSFFILFIVLIGAASFFNNCTPMEAKDAAHLSSNGGSVVPPAGTGPTMAQGGGAMLGQINSVDLLGNVSGYAINSNSPVASIDVVVYANAAFNNGGVLVGTYPANLTALNTNENNHTFRFTLPPTFADGTVRTLYVYGVSANIENLLFNSPFSYQAFPGKGRTFYENNVHAKLTCSGCHFWTYEEAFSKLAIPIFSAGGTATNNYLLNKMSATVAHGGGNQCPVGKGADPCLSVQNWWAQEF